MAYLKRHMEIAYDVKKIIKEIDSNAKVYVFGSTVRGKYTASSDIDILVITEKIGEKNRMVVEVYKHVEAPVELHTVTPEKSENWYKGSLNLIS